MESEDNRKIYYDSLRSKALWMRHWEIVISIISALIASLLLLAIN